MDNRAGNYKNNLSCAFSYFLASITVPVASGNSVTTSAFNGESAKGTWRMYINCSCPSGGLPNAYGSSTYKPTMTITY
mgnify:CR=1 FL=1